MTCTNAAAVTLHLLADARRDYAEPPVKDPDRVLISHEAAVFEAVAKTLAGERSWQDLIGSYAPAWRWHQFGDLDPNLRLGLPRAGVAVGSWSSAGTADDHAGGHIHQGLEDLKGLTGIDGYAEAEEFPEGGGRSHGATRRDRRDRGRFIATDEATRFWSKVHKTPGGCWLWTGGRTADGYGRFRITISPGRHRHVKAHRWAWEHLVGPIRPGWTLDHLTTPGPCTSTACVRPDHLEEVTRAENARRAARRRRATTAAIPRPAAGPRRGRNPR